MADMIETTLSSRSSTMQLPHLPVWHHLARGDTQAKAIMGAGGGRGVTLTGQQSTFMSRDERRVI
eukprot:3163490-Pleurochrysis_carterae.AAC.2